MPLLPPLFSPLTRLKGVNALTAGMLAALLGPGQRFHTDADLALYAGVAPLEVSSAGRVRHRVNRGGNRRLNANPLLGVRRRPPTGGGGRAAPAAPRHQPA